MSQPLRASGSTYVGLFLVALATLSHEVLLTRIFSVTMLYHFAFMAISVAMFGMTVGAILIYLFPEKFTDERVRRQMALSALAFSVSLVICFLVQLVVPSVFHFSLTGLFSIGFKYFVIAVPFVFSGICMAAALTRFPSQVGQLYAADLIGAATGCILVVLMLPFSDGPTTVLFIAAIAGMGAWCFALDAGQRQVRRATLTVALSIAAFALLHAELVRLQSPLIRLMWVKGQLESPPPLYEKWNSFSRVTVLGDSKRNREPYRKPFGWGLSDKLPADFSVDQYMLLIDGLAGTPMTRFDGDFRKVEHLRFDVTNAAHIVRHDADVFVIGAGGGRDVLSALAFDQRAVLAVELNGNILETAIGKYGEFTGHLDRDPRVQFVHDEARSFLAGTDRHFDIIQLSLIDTWAATAAGAFVLSENQLYTREAWDLFLSRLAPAGLLSVSRWYFEHRPAEMYRLTALAAETLAAAGIENPRDHLVIIRKIFRQTPWWIPRELPDGVGVGTLLLNRTPFTANELTALKEWADRMDFEIVLTPELGDDENLARIARATDLPELYAEYPLNIAPPTDDKPFFFQMLRLKDAARPELWKQGPNTPNVVAVLTVAGLFVCVVFLSAACIVLPLALTTRRGDLRGSLPFFVFFCAIGLGFMLVEIAQVQRMIVFLGHPTYGLSVLLFTLLVSSGIGSFLTGRVDDDRLRRSTLNRLLLILVSLGAFAVLMPMLMRRYEGAATSFRILLSVLALFPVGMFMGMAFPLGMRLATRRAPAITPWLWGMNGATSVCASVLGVAIALASGISTAFLVGAACYVVALAAFAWCSANARSSAPA
ncbi:MAG: hypothetical protein J5J06_08820 [Phycisphaerae bacterium]|nr:hypothetical protein [Phycisphaerae bacterium]